MVWTALIWVASSAICLFVLTGFRAARLRRIPRLEDFSWPSVFVLAIVGGAIFAIIYESVSSRRVDLPDSLKDSIMLRPPESGM